MTLTMGFLSLWADIESTSIAFALVHFCHHIQWMPKRRLSRLPFCPQGAPLGPVLTLGCPTCTEGMTANLTHQMEQEE